VPPKSKIFLGIADSIVGALKAKFETFVSGITFSSVVFVSSITGKQFNPTFLKSTLYEIFIFPEINSKVVQYPNCPKSFLPLHCIVFPLSFIIQV
jgi:hypothetical protein